MAELTKQALQVENNTSFPNNNAGLITPTVLRGFNSDMIDSLVDEISYTVDSGSWNQQIDALEVVSSSTLISISNLNASSASQQISINNLNSFTASTAGLTTGSLLVTASFNNGTRNLTFTKGDASTFNVNIPDVSGSTLPSGVISGSAQISAFGFVSGSFVTTSSFNSYTASTNSSISQLNASSASQQVSINALNTNSGSVNTSINALNGATSSYANSASVAAVDAAQQQSINSINAVTSSFLTSSADISSLNSFTASQLTINSGYNTFTSSANQRLGSLETNSGSVNTSISALNTFTQSQEGVNTLLAGEIDSLQAKTGSYATTGSNNFIGNQTITGNITAFSASFTYLQTTYESSSVIYSSGSNLFGDELSDVQTLSGSVKVQGSLTVNGTPVLTSSVDISGLTTTASFNAYTQSNDQKVNSLINATSSYATSAITASSLITASAVGNTITFTKGDASTFNVSVASTPIDTASFATTGSNLFVGNQTITGSLFISGNINMVNGADIVTHHVRAQGSNGLELQTSAGAIIVAMGAGGGTQAGFVGAVSANSISASTINGLGDPLAFSTSVDSRLDSLEGVSGSFVTTASFNSYTSSTNSRLTNIESKTGSYATTGSNTFFGNQTIDGSNKIAFGTTPNDVYINSPFNGVTNLDLNIINYSIAGGVTNMLATNAISLQSNSNKINITGKTGVDVYGETFISGALNVTGSLTASLQEGYVWVGNNSGKTVTVATSSFIDTFVSGNLVTTSSFNSYTQSTNIRLANLESTSASVDISISNLNSTTQSLNTSISNLNQSTASLFSSASLALVTASFSGNTLTFTKGDASTFGVVIPDVSGSAINTGSLATTGSNSFVGNQTITGSLILSSSNAIELQVIGNSVFTGSAFGNVVSASITSATASLNLNAGNYFTLSIPTGTTRISPSNIQAGTSATLVITTASGSLVTFDSSVKQPSGSAYIPTSGSVDILSFVSVNSSSLFVVATKNMI